MNFSDKSSKIWVYQNLNSESTTAGANPLFGGLKSSKSIFGKSSHLWIEGEGMLHALYFTKEKEKGKQGNILYKNKYVETHTFNMEKDRIKPSFLPNMEGDALAVLMASILNLVRHPTFIHLTTFICRH